MKSRLILLGILGILTVGTGILVLRFRHPDLSQEEAPIARISVPLRTIDGHSYMDGGSVYLEIVDREGVKHEFVAPIVGGVGGTYPVILSGTTSPRSSKGIPLKDTQRAKEALLGLISRYRDRRNIGLVNVKYALLGTEPGTLDELPAWIANDWWPE